MRTLLIINSKLFHERKIAFWIFEWYFSVRKLLYIVIGVKVNIFQAIRLNI